MSSELKTIWQHSRVYGVGNVLDRLAGLLLIPVLLHVLTPEQWGVYALIILVGRLFTVFLGSIGDGMYRIYYDFESESDRNLVVVTTIGLFAAGAVVLAALAYPITIGLGFILFGDQEYFVPLLLGNFVYIFQVLFMIELRYLRIRRSSILYITATLLRSLSYFSLSILFVAFLDMGVTGVVLGQLLSLVLIPLPILVGILLRAGLRFSRPIARDVISLSLPLVPAWLARNAVELVQRYMVNLLAGTAAMGLFSLGDRLTEQLRLVIADPFNMMWSVRLLELGDSRDRAAEFHRVFVYFYFLLITAALAVTLYAPEIIMLVSAREFWPAAAVVPILVVNQLLTPLSYNFEMGILQRKRTGYLPLVNGATLAFGIVALALLIPPFGIVGAAAGAAATQAVRLAGLVWFSARCSDYPRLFPWGASALLVGLAALAYFAALAICGDSVTWTHGLVKLAALGLFVAAAFLSPALTSDERRLAILATKQRLGRLRLRFQRS